MKKNPEHRAPNTRRRKDDAESFPARIDITRFKEVGRINRPSGAKSRDDYDDRVAVLDELYDDGNIELLLAFRDGVAKMDELMRFKRQRRLDAGMGDLKFNANLFQQFEEALPRMGRKRKTRDGYQSLFLRMVRLSHPKLDEHSTVRDLERQNWRVVKQRWADDKVGGTTWNNFIIMLGSFLTTVLEDVDHADRKRVMKHLKRAPKAPERVPDATPEQLAKVFRLMPRRSGATALALLLTGLRMDEWMSLNPAEDLLPNREAVRIDSASEVEGDDPFTQGAKNTKSQGIRHIASGFYGLVESALRDRPAYITLRRHWCQACHEVGLGTVVRTDLNKKHRWPQSFLYEGLRLHDLRHLYAQIVSEAGMPLMQLKAALGHGTLASSARYAAMNDSKNAARIAGDAFAGSLAIESLWPEAGDGDDDAEGTGTGAG